MYDDDLDPQEEHEIDDIDEMDGMNIVDEDFDLDDEDPDRDS